MNHPQVFIYEEAYAREDGRELLALLREFQGTPATIHVLDNEEENESYVVIRPSDGPSLARILRDWVDGWWGGDEQHVDRYGSPEAFLRRLGVVIPTGEFVSFSPSCPYCYAADTLSVTGGTFDATGMQLSADGFAFDDAKQVNTTDVQVHCEACDRTFSADAIQL